MASHGVTPPALAESLNKHEPRSSISFVAIGKSKRPRCFKSHEVQASSKPPTEMLPNSVSGSSRPEMSLCHCSTGMRIRMEPVQAAQIGVVCKFSEFDTATGTGLGY